MKTPYNRESGVTLIEVLASVVLFSVSLAGLAALALTSLRSTADGHFVSQATILAEEIADTMRSNLMAYETANFTSTPGAATKICSPGAECTAAEQSQYDASLWQGHVANALPASSALICMDSTPDDGQPDAPQCDGAGLNTVKIFWQDRRSAESLAEGENFHRYSLAMVP